MAWRQVQPKKVDELTEKDRVQSGDRRNVNKLGSYRDFSTLWSRGADGGTDVRRPSTSNWHTTRYKDKRKDDEDYHKSEIAESSTFSRKPRFNDKRTDDEGEDRRRDRKVRFGYKLLESLYHEKTPDEVLVYLITNTLGFEDYLLTDLSHDCLALLVHIIVKICPLNYKLNTTHILKMIYKLNLFDKLSIYILEMPLLSSHEIRSNKYFWECKNKFFENLFEILKTYLEIFPKATILAFMPGLLKVIKYTCDNFKDEMDIIDQFMFVSQHLEILKTSKHYQKPPNDFRTISIYPKVDEVTGPNTPFLRENVIKGKFKDVDDYLDIHFRLLREDYIAPLRQGIREYLAKETKPSNIKIHHAIKLISKVATRDQLGVMVNYVPKKIGKEFMYGSLICFTADNFKSILFGKVLNSEKKLIVGFQNMDIIDYKLNYIMVESLIYFEPYYHVLNALQKFTTTTFPLKKYIVDVEICNEMPTYNPDEYQEFINFDDYCKCKIIENKKKEKTRKYRHIDYDEDYNEFKYLSEIENYICNLRNDTKDRTLIYRKIIQGADAGTYLCLDQSQSDAFRAALTNKLCIIQGPPGTGKTYLALEIAKTLIYNYQHWKNGPILIISLTNHALDQFLEGLLETTTSILRVGGQSKSERLEEFNLKNVMHFFKFSNPPQTSMSEINEYLNELQITFQCVLNFSKFENDIINTWFANASEMQLINWIIGGKRNNDNADNDKPGFEHFYITNEDIKLMEDLLVEDEMSNALFSCAHINIKINQLETFLESASDDDEYRQIIEEQNYYIYVEEYLRGRLEEIRTENLSEYEMPNVDITMPFLLSADDRWSLYKYWVGNYRKNINNEIDTLMVDRQEENERIKEFRNIKTISVMKKALVVGMTTTGAARLQDCLQALVCPIVIVEEAAEVLEPHIIASLTSNCQHLILIGDHKQLRPSSADYKIEKDYKLGISLFERLVKNNVQCNTLNTQRRMRPEISSLIAPSIYSELRNHESVWKFPDIRGITKPLYFITHNEPEKESDTSKENDHESQYLIRLAEYLIKNGYEGKKITILAAYLGQMYNLKKNISSILRDVKICVLDNYQGEENDIILLSLVRNNNEGSIGFLSIENRVCVALSRAKYGMYIMGNMDLLCQSTKSSNPWPKIRSQLRNMNAISDALAVCCVNHPNQITHIKNIQDFNNIENGGCMQLCGEILICGHTCNLICHKNKHAQPIIDAMKFIRVESTEEEILFEDATSPYENRLPQISCNQRCTKLCPLLHNCPKLCKEKCEPCLVPKIFVPMCGHAINLPCYKDPDDELCTELVRILLKCGHTMNKECHKNANEVICTAILQIQLECGHTIDKECHKNSNEVKCTAIMQIQLKCGHTIDTECHKNGIDVTCTAITQIPLDCGHKYAKVCNDSEPTGNCAELVPKELECGHVVTVNCHDDINSIVCTQNCNKNKKNCSKPFNEQHKCTESCNKTCKLCDVLIKKKRTKCMHSSFVQCHQNIEHVFCEMTCRKILNCGHKCQRKCGAICGNCEFLVEKKSPCGHKLQITCSKAPKKNLCYGNCPIKLPCGHNCQNKCKDNCTEICNELVERINECGHKIIIECSKIATRKLCQEKCQCILACGHNCDKNCNEPCNTECSVLIESDIIQPLCGHNIIPCYLTKVKNLYTSGSMYCGKKCDTKLECGHTCIGNCTKCRLTHINCDETCNRILLCGHNCTNLCCEACTKCTQPCKNECKHSKCLNKCGEMCSKCTKQCTRQCKHAKCGKMCFQQCDIKACIEPCKNILDCGHDCIGFCGDVCPNKCRVCNLDALKYEFGEEVAEIGLFVLLEECQHLIADSMMPSSSKITINVCPICKVPITLTHRYAQVCKDLNAIKLIVHKDYLKALDYVNDKVPKLVMHSVVMQKCVSPTIEILEKFDNCDETNIISILSKIDIYEKILNMFMSFKEKELLNLILPDIKSVMNSLLNQDASLTNEKMLNYELKINNIQREISEKFTDYKISQFNYKTWSSEWYKCTNGHYYNNAPCTATIKTILPCKHVVDKPCHIDPFNFPCTQQCNALIKSCGHLCAKKCHLIQSGKCVCNYKCIKLMLGCSQPDDLKHTSYRLCSEDCKLCDIMVLETLKCGHVLFKKCSDDINAIKCDKCVALAQLIKQRENLKNIKTKIPKNTLPVEYELSTIFEKDDGIIRKCEKILNCGHQCLGSRSECNQGAIHIPCKQICNRTLICGDKCKNLCNAICQPCIEPFIYKCNHTHATNCGKQCTKQCRRSCKHVKCEKLCYEICDVKPCNESCDLKLICGHDCIGYCGDPCPNICKICDLDELQKLFGDKEYGAFVHLEDCNHDVPNTLIIDPIDALFKSCPTCNKSITKTTRYCNEMKSFCLIVNQIKQKFTFSLEYLDSISDMNYLDIDIFKAKTLTFPLLKNQANYSNKGYTTSIEIYQILIDLMKYVFENELIIKLCDSHLNDIVMYYCNRIFKYINEHSIILTDQQIMDCECELTRLFRIVSLFQIVDEDDAFNDCKNAYYDLRNMLLSRGSYSHKKDLLYLTKLNELHITMLPTNIRFDRNIGFNPGYWFICPNDHVFATEKYEAVEERICPDCFAVSSIPYESI